MLNLRRGQTGNFKFVFVSNGLIYDPISDESISDIYFYVVRGENTVGPIIDGPYSYLNQSATPDDTAYITKSNGYEYTLSYKIPQNLFEGKYSVIAQTSDPFGTLTISSVFQVTPDIVSINSTVANPNKSVAINYKPTYQQLDQANTSTLLLLGHADGIAINDPIKISSIQSAVDLLAGDTNSPLLRGVHEAYAAGARDIMVCAVAPMSEYMARVADRNNSTQIFDLSAATPSLYTFYEKYYERLAVTYSMLKELDFIDYVVPLEASMIRSGDVDFVTQLANYLGDFHNTTGYVQLGVIGARTDGLSSDDIDLFESNSVFTNKFTQYDSFGSVSSDNGRFVIPIYGEGIYQHQTFANSYSAPVVASVAGKFASMSLNLSLIRSRIPGVLSVYGADLSQNDISRLESLGINTIYRAKKTRRAIPYEVNLTNEYTMANSQSTLTRVAQMRLIARVVSEVRAYGNAAIGKFGYDKAVSQTSDYLNSLRLSKTIVDFSFNVETSPIARDGLIFYIELVSSLGLRRINFAVSTGPEL